MSGRAVPGWVGAVLGAHALLAVALAVVCALVPERLLGDTGWLPLARFAAALLASALGALALTWGAALRSRRPERVRDALLGALALDVQLPLVLALHPAFLDLLSLDTPIPWFAPPLVVIFGGAVPVLLGRRALS